jgi:hypothetical protein
MITLHVQMDAIIHFLYEENDEVSIDRNGHFVRMDRLQYARYLIRRKPGYEDEHLFICCHYVRMGDRYHRSFPTPSLQWKDCRIRLINPKWVHTTTKGRSE